MSLVTLHNSVETVDVARQPARVLAIFITPSWAE